MKGSPTAPFALLNVQTHTDSPHARVMPEVGLLTSFGPFRAMLEYSVVSTDYEGETEDAWRVRGLYRLGSRHSIHVSVRDRRSRVGSLGVSRYF